MREPKLYAKLSKCDFYKNKIQCLGHVNSEKGVAFDPMKIKAIITWSVLKDVHDIRSFIGVNRILSQIYREFFKNSSPYNYPLKEKC